jgi:hypothetical protein
MRDGGPQPQWVGSPDQGADSRTQLAHPLGQLVEINTNTSRLLPAQHRALPLSMQGLLPCIEVLATVPC